VHQALERALREQMSGDHLSALGTATAAADSRAKRVHAKTVGGRLFRGSLSLAASSFPHQSGPDSDRSLPGPWIWTPTVSHLERLGSEWALESLERPAKHLDGAGEAR
jgi:hypothetical protein